MSECGLDKILAEIKATSLGEESLENVVSFLLDEEASPQDKATLLNAWHERGESAKEISFVANHFRKLARDPQVSQFSEQAIDVCGTGGDGAGTFNISTVVSFIVAAAGVPVMKHGNRSITSKSGSADFLEALGVSLAVDTLTHQAALEHLNYTFFFAPEFHPAFKAIMPVRKELAAAGKRSLFNILGPLLNPGKPSYQILGVFSPLWVERLAATLHDLGLTRGWVVCGEYEEGKYVDELTCAGKNHAVGFGEFVGQTESWDANELGLHAGQIQDLAGGEVSENLNIFAKLPIGKANPVLLDSILLNAGLALWTAKKASSLEEGIRLARATFCSPVMEKWMQSMKIFYQDKV